MTTTNDHILIVGGSSGIGLATARRLLADGRKVTITGRDNDRLDAAGSGLTGNVSAVAFDAADSAATAAFFDRVGTFDHLVLAFSGGQALGPFRELDLSAVRRGFDGKVWPHLQCAQLACRSIRSDGSITFIAAVSAQMTAPGIAGPAAANGVLTTLTPLLAAELRPLRVNAVSPGVIDTPWWAFLPEERRQAVFADYAGRTPVGRVGTADDVAQAIVFLIDNSFVTGHVLVCDGGLRLVA